ncbi:unnamed protein product [Absidia cylindrospora]
MNTLFGFGSNGSGQLGLGHLEDVNSPKPCIGIPRNEVIKKVVGGGNHSAVLTMSGRLFLAGSSQLGSRQQKVWESRNASNEDALTTMGYRQHDDYDWAIYNESYPQHTWHNVACGWAFTLLVNTSGEVFGVGSSAFGELGFVSKKDVTELCAIAPELLVDIDSVACGWRHCVALDRGGKVYGWGWGKYGQFGVQDLDHGKPVSIYSPFTIPTPEPVTHVVCGHLHSLILGALTGKVYGCGVNKNRQIRPANDTANVGLLEYCGKPTNTNNMGDGGAQRTKGWQLTAGWHHSAVLAKGGRLDMWGKNDRGQLQDGMQNVVKVISGSEHSLAVLDNGDIIAWGWNEHGNCTTNKDILLTPVIVDNPVDTGKITILGAGCATSWIGSVPS